MAVFAELRVLRQQRPEFGSASRFVASVQHIPQVEQRQFVRFFRQLGAQSAPEGALGQIILAAYRPHHAQAQGQLGVVILRLEGGIAPQRRVIPAGLEMHISLAQSIAHIRLKYETGRLCRQQQHNQHLQQRDRVGEVAADRGNPASECNKTVHSEIACVYL